MVVGAAPHQDGDGVGIGAFSPHGRTSRSRQYGPEGPRPLPLARLGSRSKGVLPSLPDLPTNFTQSASPQPTDTTSHHRGAFRAHRDGPCGAVAKVCSGTRTHPGDCRLRHPVSRGSSPPKSYGKGHRPGTLPALQPSRHPSRNPDRSGHPFYVPANGRPLPAVVRETAEDHRLPPTDRWPSGAF